MEITPEKQLQNVAEIVKKYASPNDRGNYTVDKLTLAQSALQLADMIQQYLNGKLGIIDDEIPF